MGYPSNAAKQIGMAGGAQQENTEFFFLPWRSPGRKDLVWPKN